MRAGYPHGPCRRDVALLRDRLERRAAGGSDRASGDGAGRARAGVVPVRRGADARLTPPAPRGTAVRSKNDLDVKEIVNLWAGGSAAVKSMLGRH
jgi:hypothetical protein